MSQIRGLISLLVREVVACFCVCVNERKRNSESERVKWSVDRHEALSIGGHIKSRQSAIYYYR